MGKTKTKIIDDSLPEVEVKSKKLKDKNVKKDELVEKLKEELGIKDEVRGNSEEGSVPVSRGPLAAASKAREDARSTPKEGKDTELAGPRAPEKKPQKQGKAKPRSKKYQEVAKDLDRSKSYPIPEAVDLVKKLSYAKFNATLEAHINTAQMGVRGLVSLPYAAGKKLKILAFPPAKLNPSDKKELEDEGVVFGDDVAVEAINQGKVDFDLLITIPEWMPKLAKVARILGPRGLMPNPKNGTIVIGEDGLKKAVSSFQAGKTEYKTESKAPVIHMALGKLDQPTGELSQNVKTLLQTLGKTRIKKVSLAPTMGPSVKIDLASI